MFVIVTLAAESFAPGSVTPFLDPIPLAILALVLLGADASRREVTSRPLVRLAVSIFLMAVVLALAVSKAWSGGRLDAVMIGFVFLSVAFATYSTLRVKKDS